jgi:hypothetical protein
MDKDEIFYSWLLSDDEYRKSHNPFTQMISRGASEWPKVRLPKLN